MHFCKLSKLYKFYTDTRSFWKSAKINYQKAFVEKVKCTGSAFAGTSRDFKNFYVISRKFRLLIVGFQDNLSFNSRSSDNLRKKSMHKNSVSETKKFWQHSWRNTSVIWQKCNLKWRISFNFYVWSVEFQYFDGMWVNSCGIFRILTKNQKERKNINHGTFSECMNHREWYLL